MTRESILNRAIECVCGEREQDYGSPEDNFNRIATYWSAHLGMEITAEDVAVMMALLKIARIGTGTATDDSWVDLAGYAACGGEIAAKEADRRKLAEATAKAAQKMATSYASAAWATTTDQPIS
jgi:hypothetical protein